MVLSLRVTNETVLLIRFSGKRELEDGRSEE